MPMGIDLRNLVGAIQCFHCRLGSSGWRSFPTTSILVLVPVGLVFVKELNFKEKTNNLTKNKFKKYMCVISVASLL